MLAGRRLARSILRGFPLCRAIHARAENTTLAQRQKQLERPRPDANVRRPKPPKKAAEFLLSPVTKAGPRASAELRRRIQHSKAPAELLSHLDDAVAAGGVDVSVLAAAMKRCEQGKWWEALVNVKDLQVQQKLPMTPILLSSYFTALSRCANAEDGVQSIKTRRQDALLRAQEAWDAYGRAGDLLDEVLANGILHVCLSSREERGLLWAQELWRSLKKDGARPNVVNCSTYATVLEMHDKKDEVDALLDEASAGLWRPNEVTLGSLLNSTAEGRHWQRSERLWDRLTVGLQVKPSKIAWAARVKAHILCGRPRRCAELVRECMASGIQLHYKLAEDLVQASMVVYHSSLASQQKEDLEQAIEICSSTFEAEETSKRQKKDWGTLHDVARCLVDAPSAFRLRGILLEQKAKNGAMASWPNYDAGSRYLDGEES